MPRQRCLGLGAAGRVLGVQSIAILLHERFPVPGGQPLVLGLGLLEGELVGLHPAVAALLVAQLLPGRLALGIEPDHGVIVGQGLLLEARLIAPLGELPLGIGPVGRRRPLLEILLQAPPALAGSLVSWFRTSSGFCHLPPFATRPSRPRAVACAGLMSVASVRCLIRSAESPWASHQRASLT